MIEPLNQSLTKIELNTLFAILGSLAVVWGSLQACLQTRLKLLIAYSTVAQLGYLFISFTLGEGWKGGLILAVSHAFAKAAMFLCAGNIVTVLLHDHINQMQDVARKMPMTLAAFALAGVSIIGLPPSGGFSGKWIMMHHALAQQKFLMALVLLLGSLLAGAYVFRVISQSFVAIPEMNEDNALHRTKNIASLEWISLALAVVAFGLGLFIMPLLAWLSSGLV